jgi:hypothetical protein
MTVHRQSWGRFTAQEIVPKIEQVARAVVERNMLTVLIIFTPSVWKAFEEKLEQSKVAT